MAGDWTILNYHNVDWEDGPLTRPLGFTTRPDVFADHLQQFAAAGDLISIQAGLQRLERGERFPRPAFSLWFDDGFRGVREYALPLCARHGITAGMSICSRFVERDELFWRCKLAYLAAVDGLPELRRRWRTANLTVPMKLRGWTLTHFSEDLLPELDQLFAERAPADFRAHALRAFDDVAGVKTLADAGWLIANHTAAHYPLTAERGAATAIADFEACSPVVRHFADDRYWVLPFDQGGAHYLDTLRERAIIVFVGNRGNNEKSWQRRVLYRHATPDTRDISAWLAALR